MVQLTIQPAGKKIILAPDLPYVAAFPDPTSTMIGDVKKLINVKYPKVRSNPPIIAVSTTGIHYRHAINF